MFHDEQKQKFIDNQMILSNANEIDQIRQNWKNFFIRLSIFEEEKQKDFAMMDGQEIEEVLSRFLKGGKKYQIMSLNMLSKYFEWCLVNNLTFLSQNILIKRNISTINTSSSYANSMVKDENDLEQYFEQSKIFQPIEYESIDNLYRCYFHLLFTGLSVDEAFDLLEKDIYLDNNYILINNKKFVMSAMTSELVKCVINMTSVKRAVGEGRIRSDNIIKTGYLLENTVSKEKKMEDGYRQKMKKTWYVNISKKFSNRKEVLEKYLKRELTPSTVIKSGLFSRMYQNEKENNIINCREYLEMYKNNVTTIDNPNLVTSICKIEYDEWKKAFELN